ncbi:immunoglobulin mu Fc receptor isoform X1 [Dasypus novemcinctus]|uniref:immunoglobulin mu Fc receptor isoform X1 n=1 Tax=Dasypus novemcinctus TaxID=9361 RepID=UPI00265E9381|nr:fas apoptotic inhibitory molecule 3 isoform X2 [Dasypus novemcinctus]
MDLWLWSLFFLPVSGALRMLPEVKLEGEPGGSITIECPLPEPHERLYLCRVVATSGVCSTVVSNTNFVKEEYKSRVTLQRSPDKHLFLVEVTELTESDSGVYACGAGRDTDRDKTQQVTLSVSREYNPFLEEMLKPEPSRWFPSRLHLPMPFTALWPHVPTEATPEFISKATTVQRTQTPPVHHSSPSSPITHHPQVASISSAPAAKPPTLQPSTSAQVALLRLRTASYNHHTRLHRQRAFNRGLSERTEDQGFHILIPTILGLILLALLGMMIKRSIRRRKAFSRQVRRLAMRMHALEASQRRLSQRPRASQRPRPQNIYSACPRRARGEEAAGEQAPPRPGPGASEASAGLQVSGTLWLPGSWEVLKTSCECLSFDCQPPAKVGGADSEDYINIPCLTHQPGSPSRPGSLCQGASSVY